MSKKLHNDCPLDSHPLADILPILKGEPAEAFALTIREQGVKTPIVILQTGANIGHGRFHEAAPLILGGRNRVKFGMESGIPWETIPKRDYDLATDGTPEEFVSREDINGRRHLTPEQLALFGGKMLKARTAAIQAERDAAEAAQAKADKLNPPVVDQPRAPLGDGDSAEAGPAKKSKKSKSDVRASHEARKDIASNLGVSEESVKKGAAIEKHKDLAAAVADGSLSLDAAYKQASERKAADLAKKHDKRIKEERTSNLQYLKTTFGADSPFTKAVTAKKVFGDESRGHKDFAMFIELTFEQQEALIPLLYDGMTMKQALNVYETFPTFESTVLDTVNFVVANGLVDSKTGSISLEFGDYTVTVAASKDESRRLKGLSKK